MTALKKSILVAAHLDCVKLAVNKILKRKPDLCVSGINHGSNSSINVIYSGTMSAALEGAIDGIPSIGFSLLDYAHDADFSASQEVVRKLVTHVLKEGLPEGSCLNVNIPKSSLKDIKGIRFADKQRLIGLRSLMSVKTLPEEFIIGLQAHSIITIMQKILTNGL